MQNMWRQLQQSRSGLSWVTWVLGSRDYEFYCRARKRAVLVVRDTRRSSTFCSARISALGMKIRVCACETLGGASTPVSACRQYPSTRLCYILQTRSGRSAEEHVHGQHLHSRHIAGLSRWCYLVLRCVTPVATVRRPVARL